MGGPERNAKRVGEVLVHARGYSAQLSEAKKECRSFFFLDFFSLTLSTRFFPVPQGLLRNLSLCRHWSRPSSHWTASAWLAGRSRSEARACATGSTSSTAARSCSLSSFCDFSADGGWRVVGLVDERFGDGGRGSRLLWLSSIRKMTLSPPSRTCA